MRFTPLQISKVLTRSSGAVANALDKLVSLGVAELASDKPRSYRLAPAAPHPARPPPTTTAAGRPRPAPHNGARADTQPGRQARRPGHAVLLKIYAHCIDGQADAANQRITDAFSTQDSEQDPGDERDDDSEQAS